MTTKRISSILLSAILIAAAGCGKVAEKAAEKATEAAVEHAINADGGNADVKMNMKDGKMSMTIAGKDADGKPINVQMNGSENGVNINSTTTDANGQVTQVTSKDGNVTVVTKDTDGKATETVAQGNDQGMTIVSGAQTMSMGDKATVPEDFPKDVPLFAGAKITLATTDKSSGSAMLQMTTSAKPADVAGFYIKEMTAKGWTKDMDMTQDNMYMVALRNDKRVVSVTCTQENGATTIFLALGTE